MLNILPFVEPFIEQWLLNSQLMIYELPSERWIALGAMIDTFVQTKNLSAKVDVPKIIERVMHG